MPRAPRLRISRLPAPRAAGAPASPLRGGRTFKYPHARHERMGWRGALRSMQAAARQAEREAERGRKASERAHRAYLKERALADAAAEVRAYEEDVRELTTLHHEVPEAWDWDAIVRAPIPPAPPRSDANEARATRALNSFRPSFFDKLFGRSTRKRDALVQGVTRARVKDEAGYKAARAAYEKQVEEQAELQALAKRILKREGEAFAEAIRAYQEDIANEIRAQSVGITIDAENRMQVVIQTRGDEVLPPDKKTLLRSGKASVKAHTKTEFYAMYADYLAGSAIRVAHEVFALLPVDSVLCHVNAPLLNASTGHIENQPVLSVYFVRETIEGLNLSRTDASDCLANFVHRAALKKTQPPGPVQPLDIHSLRKTSAPR